MKIIIILTQIPAATLRHNNWEPNEIDYNGVCSIVCWNIPFFCVEHYGAESCDVFAFGTMLYEIIIGNKNFWLQKMIIT